MVQIRLASAPALTRVLDHYQHTAAGSDGILFPGRAPALPPMPRPTSPAPPLADTASARAWLDAERLTLSLPPAMPPMPPARPITRSGSRPRCSSTSTSAAALPEALSVHASACRRARRLGDRAAEAEALRNAGVIEVRRAATRRPRSISTERWPCSVRPLTGLARPGPSAAWPISLGTTAGLDGRPKHAARCSICSTRLATGPGGPAHVNLGLADLRQGHYAEAAGHFLQALGLARETGNRICEAYALRGLGEAAVAQDRYPEATDYLDQALAFFRQTADRKGEADTLHDFGNVDQSQGRYQGAQEHRNMALSICREIGYGRGRAEALNGLGRALLAMGQPEDALLRHDDARVLADEGADAYQKARAHQGLRHAYAAVRNRPQAREQWRLALAMYTRLGTPEADQIQAQLRIR